MFPQPRDEHVYRGRYRPGRFNNAAPIYKPIKITAAGARDQVRGQLNTAAPVQIGKRTGLRARRHTWHQNRRRHRPRSHRSIRRAAARPPAPMRQPERQRLIDLAPACGVRILPSAAPENALTSPPPAPVSDDALAPGVHLLGSIAPGSNSLVLMRTNLAAHAAPAAPPAHGRRRHLRHNRRARPRPQRWRRHQARHLPGRSDRARHLLHRACATKVRPRPTCSLSTPPQRPAFATAA